MLWIENSNVLQISEICRVQQGGRPPGRDARLLDVYNEKPTRVSAKVSIPIREHPNVRQVDVKNAVLNYTQSFFF